MIERPALRAVVALEEWDATGVVVVDMRGDGQDLDVLDAVAVLKLIEVVLDEADGLVGLAVDAEVEIGDERLPVVDEERLAFA